MEVKHESVGAFRFRTYTLGIKGDSLYVKDYTFSSLAFLYTMVYIF